MKSYKERFNEKIDELSLELYELDFHELPEHKQEEIMEQANKEVIEDMADYQDYVYEMMRDMEDGM